MATTSSPRSPRTGSQALLSPLRRSRNVIEEQQGPATALGPDGLTEDERKTTRGTSTGPAASPGTLPRAEPLVLDAGTAVVAYDGGPDGRAALDFAITGLRGPIVVAHVCASADPLPLLAVPGPAGTAARILRDVEREDERARRQARRVALAGAAIAREAGRDATGIAIHAAATTPPLEAVAEWAERRGAAQLVIAAGPPRRWSRLLGPSTAGRLVGSATCPVTVVPARAR